MNLIFTQIAQTDLTYAVRNKKIQTVRIDESDSDDDPDIANQSLNQSMMVNSGDARALGLRSFGGQGFANVAMHALVSDELRSRSRVSMATEASSTDLERSGNKRGAYHHYSRPTEGDIQEEQSRGTACTKLRLTLLK